MCDIFEDAEQELEKPGQSLGDVLNTGDEHEGEELSGVLNPSAKIDIASSDIEGVDFIGVER